MAPLKVEQYVVGPVQTNCYFAINDDTKEVLVIDPGASADQLAKKIRQEKLIPIAILLTHGHFDHAGGAEELAKHFDIKIYAEEHEKETLDTPSLNLSGWEGVQKTYHADVFLKNEQEIDLAGFHIRVFHTPGHTEGGTCYYIESIGVLFSGDTLFCESVGRTDFPGGSMSDIVHSIKDKLMVLPDDTKVYTGHGEGTSIGYERVHNPFIGA